MLVPLTTGAALLSGGADPGNVALKTIQQYDTPAFYLHDPNPALRMPSGLRRGYQDFANTPVTASTQTAALALDLSEGAAIGAELVGADYTALWSDVGNIDVQTAQIVASSSVNEQVNAAGLVESGNWYRVAFDLAYTAGVCRVRLGDTSGPNFQTETSSAGSKVFFMQAVGGDDLAFRTGGAASDWVATNISVKKVSGYHFSQTTSADEPSLNLTSGLYGYLGDGTSKHFKTGLVGAASGTFIVAMNYTGSLSVTPIGCETGVSRIRFDVNNTNTMKGYVGSTTSFEISSGSVKNIPGIAALRWSGSSVYGLWKPIGGSIETASGSFAGSVPTTQPIYLAGNDDDGTANKFFQGTIWRALAQQSAYTDAEIAAIANQWSRELAALA